MDITSAIDEYLGAKQNSITAKTLRWYTYELGTFDITGGLICYDLTSELLVKQECRHVIQIRL